MRESKGKARESRSAQQLSEDYQIDLDVPRTISGHTLFVTRYGSGQRNLFHVLHCFSLICDSCGYCQGMGPIAATLLCYFEPEVSASSRVYRHY
uniref:Rab-GAP TBC domain-containing protein n=1 Tax=Solanum lycopersicum TaxID=4081 RepID=A0A494G9J0_SOLLC